MTTALEDLRAAIKRWTTDPFWADGDSRCAEVICAEEIRSIIEKLERRESEVYAALIAADKIFGTWYSAEYTNHKLAKPIRELLHGPKR